MKLDFDNTPPAELRRMRSIIRDALAAGDYSKSQAPSARLRLARIEKVLREKHGGL